MILNENTDQNVRILTLNHQNLKYKIRKWLRARADCTLTKYIMQHSNEAFIMHITEFSEKLLS